MPEIFQAWDVLQWASDVEMCSQLSGLWALIQQKSTKLVRDYASGTCIRHGNDLMAMAWFNGNKTCTIAQVWIWSHIVTDLSNVHCCLSSSLICYYAKQHLVTSLIATAFRLSSFLVSLPLFLSSLLHLITWNMFSFLKLSVFPLFPSLLSLHQFSRQIFRLISNTVVPAQLFQVFSYFR